MQNTDERYMTIIGNPEVHFLDLEQRVAALSELPHIQGIPTDPRLSTPFGPWRRMSSFCPTPEELEDQLGEDVWPREDLNSATIKSESNFISTDYYFPFNDKDRKRAEVHSQIGNSMNVMLCCIFWLMSNFYTVLITDADMIEAMANMKLCQESGDEAP